MRIVIFRAMFTIIFVNSHLVSLSESSVHCLLFKNIYEYIMIKIWVNRKVWKIEICIKQKSILKSGSDVSFLSFSFHIFHQFEDFSLLFLLDSVLSPETKEERIENKDSDNCQTVNENFLFFNSFLTINFLNILFAFLNVFMMDVPLANLIVKQIFEGFGSVNLELSCIVSIKLSNSKSHSLLLVHLSELCLLMQSYLQLKNKVLIQNLFVSSFWKTFRITHLYLFAPVQKYHM